MFVYQCNYSDTNHNRLAMVGNLAGQSFTRTVQLEVTVWNSILFLYQLETPGQHQMVGTPCIHSWTSIWMISHLMSYTVEPCMSLLTWVEKLVFCIYNIGAWCNHWGLNMNFLLFYSFQNGYGFKTNGGSEFVDLGNWTGDTCLVDIDTCEQGLLKSLACLA